jgi:hypothetical protein
LEAAGASGGSIGDYNVAAGLNVAAMIGEIRRAVPSAPAVPPAGGSGDRGGVEIENLTIYSQAANAEELFDDIRRVARARAQAIYGSPGMAAEAFA